MRMSRLMMFKFRLLVKSPRPKTGVEQLCCKVQATAGFADAARSTEEIAEILPLLRGLTQT